MVVAMVERARRSEILRTSLGPKNKELFIEMATNRPFPEPSDTSKKTGGKHEKPQAMRAVGVREIRGRAIKETKEGRVGPQFRTLKQ